MLICDVACVALDAPDAVGASTCINWQTGVGRRQPTPHRPMQAPGSARRRARARAPMLRCGRAPSCGGCRIIVIRLWPNPLMSNTFSFDIITVTRCQHYTIAGNGAEPTLPPRPQALLSAGPPEVKTFAPTYPSKPPRDSNLKLLLRKKGNQVTKGNLAPHNGSHP